MKFEKINDIMLSEVALFNFADIVCKIGKKVKMSNELISKDEITNELVNEIKDLIINARNKVAQQVNETLVDTYWNIGKVIVEKEQSGQIKAEYGKAILLNVSKRLSKEIGKGFSKSNLFNMRKFYLMYSKIPDTSGILGWSHYCELISIKEDAKRQFYEKETINSKWSVRELQRQIETSLFERLLLSDGKANKEKVLQLAREGQILNKPEDVIKDPYVFEFLGVPEQKPLLEKDLEYKLINHIEKFLLELGKGFMFVGSQQRITIGNVHYYVDMVFYNKILKAYVLIDLKMGNLKPENFGQMNMYLNYYEEEINEEGDNKPIGIILCADKDNVVAEYSIGGMNNNLFASNYTYYIPKQEELIAQVEQVIRENEEEKKNKENK